MDYEFFEHEADQGIRCFGKTNEEAFENGARALFEIMCNTNKIQPEKEVELTATAEDLEALFVEWLNELLTQKDIHGLMFSDFKVNIKQENKQYSLKAKAFGEPVNPEKQEFKLEVKAATYAGLDSGEDKGIKYFQCIVDV